MGCEKQGYFTLVCITHFFEELILVLISIKLYMLSCVDQNILLCCQDEWRTGLKALRADSISKLKKAFPELVQEVSLSPKYNPGITCMLDVACGVKKLTL